MADVSRRAVLLGGLGVFSAAAGGWRRSRPAPARSGDDQGLVHPTPTGSARRRSRADGQRTFTSARRNGARTGWAVSYPPGHDDAPLPVLVALHGRTGTHTDAFGTSLHLDRFLADAVRHGTAPFAIASVDGGDHSYWHPRRADDAAGMVIDEFLPLLAGRGLRTARVALLGWSMGGYGALYLAGRLGRERTAATVAESPAIWHTPDQSAAGAFDDAADFNAHAVFGRLSLLAGIPLRVDCGAGDGFAPVTRDLRAALIPTPAGGIEPGGHDDTYWRSQAPAQLRFVGAHLTR